MIEKLRENKKIWLIIAAAEILLMCLAGFFYSRREPVDISFTQDDLLYDSGEPGFYIDTTTGSQVSSPEFTLPRGMYTVTIQYEYEGLAVMNISYTDGRLVPNLSGDIQTTTSGVSVCDFKVNYGDRPMKVNGRMRGDAWDGCYLLIREIHITDSPVAMRNFLFQIALMFLLIDAVLAVMLLKNKWNWDKETIFISKGLFLLIVFSSIPLMVDYLLGSSHDINFHLARIEGLKEGLQNGMFPVRIQPNWLDGHGYAVSVFYGDLFLYIPAVIRMFGVSIQAVYQFYVVLVNTATVLLSFYCFAKMSESKRVGLFCSAIYSLNLYRLICIYNRASVGEYTAMVFLPVILYGFWKAYTKPEDSKEHRKSWITIALGYTGVFLSHMISCEMVALFTIVLCIVLWKKTFRKKTFITLAKGAISIVILNLWFIVPLLDYLKNGVYILNDPNGYAPYRLEERASFVAQLFMNTYDATGTSMSHANGIMNEMPQTPGIVPWMLLAVWFLLYAGRKGVDKSKKRTEWLCIGFCILALFLSTYLMPYALAAKLLPIFEFPERSLQFPWRFLSIAGVFFAWLACILMGRKEVERKKRYIIAAILVGTACWQALTFMSAVLQENEARRIYQAGNLTSFEVGGGEYLPLGSETEDYVDDITYDESLVSVASWFREGAAVIVEAENLSQETQQIEVPLLYYKGYTAEDADGNQMQITTGKSGRITVSVPAGFQGSFQVEFREPWYWRVTEVISLGMLFAILYFLIRDFWSEKRKKLLIA